MMRSHTVWCYPTCGHLRSFVHLSLGSLGIQVANIVNGHCLICRGRFWCRESSETRIGTSRERSARERRSKRSEELSGFRDDETFGPQGVRLFRRGHWVCAVRRWLWTLGDDGEVAAAGEGVFGATATHEWVELLRAS
jgi:hypothetical protein